PVTVTVCGPGAGRAERRLKRLLAGVRPERLIFLGIAGGLSPTLAVGDLVQASEVVGPGGERFRPTAPAWISAARPGTLATAPRVLVRAAEKAELWERLGRPAVAAVDMETAVWARLADRHTVPWAALRAISDPAEESLPLDFNRYLDAEGGVSGLRVALAALPRPVRMARLLDLRRRLRRVAELLADAAVEAIGG
ncbi:MAG: hypothetical protein R3325_06265, partial [Thermoanaerobaculia bacterium]|nr:hypothetical protein [Thermoanaerobaculia bacterium]